LNRRPLRGLFRRREATTREPRIVSDIAYLVLTAGLLALSFGFVRLCDRV
jgi:hypothetical protein